MIIHIALVPASLGAEKAIRFLGLRAAFSSGVFLLIMEMSTAQFLVGEEKRVACQS